MDALCSAELEELLQVEEIGDKIGESVLEFFKDKSNVHLVEALEAAGLQMKVSASATPEKLSSRLEGQSL